jgi:hypothetical protein
VSVDTGTRSAGRSEGGAPFFVSLDEAGARTIPFPPEGDRKWTASFVVRHYFGQSPTGHEGAPDSGPHALLVEILPAPAPSGAHFHDGNQFQIIYPAAGVLYKRRAIERPLLHYTDAYSAYGPFSGEVPISDPVGNPEAVDAEILIEAADDGPAAY